MHCLILCDLKAGQINVPRSSMLCKFELRHITVEATKNICCQKDEGAVFHSIVTRGFKKFCSGYTKLDNQTRSSWTKNRRFRGCAPSYWGKWRSSPSWRWQKHIKLPNCALHTTKILQNFWFLLVIQILRNPFFKKVIIYIMLLLTRLLLLHRTVYTNINVFRNVRLDVCETCVNEISTYFVFRFVFFWFRFFLTFRLFTSPTWVIAFDLNSSLLQHWRLTTHMSWTT